MCICKEYEEIESLLNISKIEVTDRDYSFLAKVLKIKGKEKRKKMIDRYLDVQFGIPRTEDIMEVINSTRLTSEEESSESY